MERLTEKGYKYHSCDFMEDGTHEWANRLSEYEDTGLTPEQIREMDKLYQEMCREVAELRKKTQWIPVSEQPLDNGVTVLASVRHRRWICDYEWGEKEWTEHPEHYEVCTVRRYDDNYVKLDEYDDLATCVPVKKQEDNIASPIEEVIAWMPLPESYKGE